jgi:V8-like Glu-specific endopeptidase
MRARRTLPVVGALLVLIGSLAARGEALGGRSLRPADATTRSWLVAVERRDDAAELTGERSCTGAEISPGFVLTAAHCVAGTSAALVRVRTADGTVRGGREYRMHPNYQGTTKASSYDIAVIELDAPLGGTIFPKLAGTGSRTPGNGRGGVHGWSEERAVSATMNAATTEATRWYRSFRVRNQTALRGSGTVACFGDSGAPMTRRTRDGRSTVLAGVLSYGESTCDPKAPVVFTRVETNRGFIAEAVRQMRANLETRTWTTTYGDGSTVEASLRSGPRGVTLAVQDSWATTLAIAVERAPDGALEDVAGCAIGERVADGVIEIDLDGACLRAGGVTATLQITAYDGTGNRVGAVVLYETRP